MADKGSGSENWYCDIRKGLPKKWERYDKYNHISVLKHFSKKLSYTYVCEVGTVGKISDYQLEGPRFNPRPGRGLNFGRSSFATPSVDRDVKPLV